MAYLHLKSGSISSLDTCFYWARKPTWLSKLECYSNMLLSDERSWWPNSVRIYIWSSWWVYLRSDERIIFTRASRHLKLLESIASSVSLLGLNLLLLGQLSYYGSYEVSNKRLLDPRSFLGFSLLLKRLASVFKVGEKQLTNFGVELSTRSMANIFFGTSGM